MVADRDRVERTVDRLADRIRAELGAPALVGIRRRGVPLAEAIVEVGVPPYESALRVVVRRRAG